MPGVALWTAMMKSNVFSSLQLKVSGLKCHIFSVRVRTCEILPSFPEEKVLYHSLGLSARVISWKNPRESMERCCGEIFSAKF